MAEPGKVKLLSSDNVELEVDNEVALQMVIIKDFIQHGGSGTTFPVNVSSTILAKVIEYIKYHLEAKESGRSEEEVKNWDKRFVDVDQKTLYDLLMASTYLKINELFEFLGDTVADKIRDLSPEQIVALFGIRNEFTQEEAEEIRREIEWAYD
ncbi:hypothetical protein SUGI_0490710 [Cryptomeria japonica]|uniref:SKP1-like protein 1B n=1 Tax=Cryptomeria japonica TaxID=3369 RepID=UPI002408EB89|nr:SKP1-like protein 1B [Cryptomeria japonica]GLJ25615.1 hypothetical protein SUGI_0490710 [Cryptomeria japonica]